jgi:thiamine biosynthesis protein ThiI
MRVRIRWHELGLKGGNRSFFVDRLRKALLAACQDLPGTRVKVRDGRMYVEVPDPAPWDLLRERLARVPGVANFARTRVVPAELEALRAAALEELGGGGFASFRVRVRRADKSFPLRAGELEAELGSAIAVATGAAVDLERPERTLHVEMARRDALLATEREPGPGGMPVGTGGRVLALVSGGIDSPVAAWRMIRRGCNVSLVNFHAFPLQDRTMQDKARELARALTRWQGRTRLFSVAFAPAQQAIVAGCSPRLRVLLYRRAMLRIAEALMPRVRARALCTGDSLGQVASQTLPNLAAVSAAVQAPVLRPLLGMDKAEITADARRAGTFEISALPDQDCCQLFVPKRPALAATAAELEAAEAALDLRGLVRDAVYGAEELRFSFPPERVEVRRHAVCP